MPDAPPKETRTSPPAPRSEEMSALIEESESAVTPPHAGAHEPPAVMKARLKNFVPSVEALADSP